MARASVAVMLLIASLGLSESAFTKSARNRLVGGVSSYRVKSTGNGEARAILDFDSVKGRLKFGSKNNRTQLRNYHIPATIVSPYSGDDLYKVLLDPSYVSPGQSPNKDDFLVKIQDVRPANSASSLSSLASCKWMFAKTQAICKVSQSGGSFSFAPYRRGTSLGGSLFAITIDGKGFLLGENGSGPASEKLSVWSDASGGSTQVFVSFKEPPLRTR